MTMFPSVKVPAVEPGGSPARAISGMSPLAFAMRPPAPAATMERTFRLEMSVTFFLLFQVLLVVWTRERPGASPACERRRSATAERVLTRKTAARAKFASDHWAGAFRATSAAVIAAIRTPFRETSTHEIRLDRRSPPQPQGCCRPLESE